MKQTPERSGVSPLQTVSPERKGQPANLAGLIDSLFRQLLSRGASAEELEAFRQSLLSLNPAEALDAIRSFLAAGQDAPTGEEFVVGEGGVLSGASTLRVLLMDLLGRISAKAKSPIAAQVSRGILEQKTSADEWAISLRNVGWSEPRATEYLARKAEEMLGHKPWRSAPSAGFLESFDVAVFTADPRFVPLLAEALESGQAPLSRAATVALDRLSEASTMRVLDYLNTHPKELAAHPFLRADYYAKANLGDPAQRAAVESYLSRADVGLPEKAKLLDGLIAPASIITDALLSPPVLRPDDPALVEVVRQTYTSWLQANRFPTLQAPLQQALRNLP